MVASCNVNGNVTGSKITEGDSGDKETGEDDIAKEETTSNEKYSIDKYKKTMYYHDDFKILWLTDLHFGNPTNTKDYDEIKEYTHLKAMIEEAGIVDLIMLTGDVFDGETEAQVDTFITFMDLFNTKWAFTFGNHDLETMQDNPFYINKKIMESKNAVYVDYEDDEIDGYTNYYINLVSNNKNIYRLFLVDSNANKPTAAGGDSVYDIIHDNQLDHLALINKTENDSAPGLAFFHIPLREYNNAYIGYTASPQVYAGQGEKREYAGFGYKNNGAYRIMQENGVIGTFVGHAHNNDFDIDYFDDNNHMEMSFGLKGTDLNYNDGDLIGYKIITLPNDPGSFDHTCIKEYKKGY